MLIFQIDNIKYLDSIGDVKHIHYLSNDLTILPVLYIHKFKLVIIFICF